MSQRTPRELPYAKTKMAQFLDKRITSLQSELGQRDIAAALGYERPNIISMFKTGETKVPLDKIPTLAKAIKVDPAHLMRLGLEQYWPDQMQVITEVFKNLVTANEMEIVEIYRSAVTDRDLPITEGQRRRLREVFEQR